MDATKEALILDTLALAGYERAVELAVSFGMWTCAVNLMLCCLGVPLNKDGTGNLFYNN